MTNLYRLCLVIFFASLSSAIAQMCSVASCEESTGYKCSSDGKSISYVVIEKTDGEAEAKEEVERLFKVQCGLLPLKRIYKDGLYLVASSVDEGWGGGCSSTVRISPVTKPVEKQFCSIDVDPKPTQSAQELLNAWNNCESGKASPLFVGSPDQLKWLNGRPVTKLMCDQPPIDALIYFENWDDYANNRNPKIPNFNDKGPDEPEKPIDPTNPTDPVNPTDPTNPTDPVNPTDPDGGGNGGDNNGGNGNGNGSGSESGSGLTKGDITEAINDALKCTDALCNYNFADSAGDAGFSEVPRSFWEQKYNTTLAELYEDKIVKEHSFVNDLANMDVDIGPGKCPVFDLGDWGEFQPNCEFLDLIRMANIFSATFFAFMLVFRR